MEIQNRVAVITGAASGIGKAIAGELAKRGAYALALVDLDDRVEQVAESINNMNGGGCQAISFIGNAIDERFRYSVFDTMIENYGVPTICVPAAGITRDSLCVRIDKDSGKSAIYPMENFQLVLSVNLMAPVYWALELVARVAEDRAAKGLRQWDPNERMQGVIVFIGSVSSQGNKGQISYAAAKAGLEGAAATLNKEAIYHGVRCAVIHPGFTDTPMVQALGDDFISQRVLPYTQLRRLIRPEEIADAICFMITNSAVSGELWADAGWHPSA